MREMFKMFIVLVILSTSAGAILAMVKEKTKTRIEVQQLEFTKAPVIREVFKNATNNPLEDRFKLNYKDKEKIFFIGKIKNKKAIMFESFGNGFGGDIGFMVGINIKNDKIMGVGVTTHSETPGLGDRAKTDKKFLEQFKDMPINSNFAIKSEDGTIDALSGATLTSIGICKALNNAKLTYQKLKPEILNHIN